MMKWHASILFVAKPVFEQTTHLGCLGLVGLTLKKVPVRAVFGTRGRARELWT